MAADLFDLLTKGVLSVDPGKAYPLAQADAAQAELASRQAPGLLLLIL
jgi:NADPH:quinone reductase